MSKQDTIYSLRKRIKELEAKNLSIIIERDGFRDVCSGIFDSLVACSMNQYVEPLKLLSKFRRISLRIKYF